MKKKIILGLIIIFILCGFGLTFQRKYIADEKSLNDYEKKYY